MKHRVRQVDMGAIFAPSWGTAGTELLKGQLFGILSFAVDVAGWVDSIVHVALLHVGAQSIVYFRLV